MRLNLTALVLFAFAVSLLAACGSSSKRGPDDDTTDMDAMVDMAPDTTPDMPVDMAPDVPDTNDMQDVPTDEVTDATPPPTPVEAPFDPTSEGNIQGLERAIAVDVDGDGYPDLVGLTDAGTATAAIAISRFDPAGGTRPPFTFEAAVSVPLTIPATDLRDGDFDGDGNRDLAVYDANGGEAGIILSSGFDNPIIAFDNPIIAFDNPIIAFDNPIIATDADWLAADLDGNGLDDLAFFAGEKGISIAWVDTAAAPLGSPLSIDLQQPTGLSDFDNPIIATPRMGVATNIDGMNGLDLLIGFDMQNNTDNDAVAPFVAQPGRTFDNPIIAMGGGLIMTGKGLAALDAGDYNLDGAGDASWLVSAADGTSNIGVWQSSQGFDNPIIANEPAVSSAFQGEFNGLTDGRLLVDQNAGFGAGGADGLALLDATTHFILVPTDATGNAVAIGLGRDGVIGFPLSLTGSVGVGRQAVDFNGDGFVEFVSPGTDGFAVLVQNIFRTLDYDNDLITLADGSTIAACELIAPWCDEGVVGVCKYGRATCGNTCTAGADFSSIFGAPFANVLEAGGELTCDTLDNDCNGVTDVLGTIDVDLGAPMLAPQSLSVVELLGGVGVVVDPGAGPLFISLWGDLALPFPGDLVAGLESPSGGGAQVAGNGSSVAVLGEFASYLEVHIFDPMAQPAVHSVWFDPFYVDDAKLFTIGNDYATAIISDVEGNYLEIQPFNGQFGVFEPLNYGIYLVAAAGYTNRALLVLDDTNTGVQEFVAYDTESGNEIGRQTLVPDIANTVETFFDGDDTGACHVHVTLQDFHRIDATLFDVTEAGGMMATVSLAQTAAFDGLFQGELVPYSVHADWNNGTCHVNWMTTVPSASGEFIVHEAILDPSGAVVREQSLGTVAVDDSLLLDTAGTTAGFNYLGYIKGGTPDQLAILPQCLPALP